MSRPHATDHHHRPAPDGDRQTASLAGLAVALALLVASLFLVGQLRARSHLEDCLLAGRADCVAVVPLDRR